jgi:RNA polymerase sigma-70 factor (ECF subfamily)
LPSGNAWEQIGGRVDLGLRYIGRWPGRGEDEADVSNQRNLTELHPELLAYAQSLTLDKAAAEDLVHDALLRALQSKAVPRKADEVRPWAFRVLKNLFLDVRRRQKVRAGYAREEALLNHASAHRSLDPVEALIVRQAYDSLSAHDREVICLIDILGLTYAEASAVMDVPIGTVMSRISRARRAMLDIIEGSNVRPLRKHKQAK